MRTQEDKAHSGGEKVGYARVSTIGQKLDSQIDALEFADCMKIFSDQQSGVLKYRPGWDRLMEYIRPGDTLIISELSRMSRSLKHLLEVVEQLEKRNVSIVSLREHIDTATATGRCFLSMMGAVSQMERELKAERAAAGRGECQSQRPNGRKTPNPC